MTAVAATSPLLSLADPAASRAGAGDGFAPVLASLLAGDLLQAPADTLHTPGNDLPPSGKLLPGALSIAGDQPPATDAPITAGNPTLSSFPPRAEGTEQPGGTPAPPALPATQSDEAPPLVLAMRQRPTRFAPTNPTPVHAGASAERTRTATIGTGDTPRGARNTSLDPRDTALDLPDIAAPAIGGASPPPADTSLPRQTSLPPVGTLPTLCDVSPASRDVSLKPGDASGQLRSSLLPQDTSRHPRDPFLHPRESEGTDLARSADQPDGATSQSPLLDFPQLDPITVTPPALAMAGVVPSASAPITVDAPPAPADPATRSTDVGPASTARTRPASPLTAGRTGPRTDIEPAAIATASDAPGTPSAQDLPLPSEDTFLPRAGGGPGWARSADPAAAAAPLAPSPPAPAQIASRTDAGRQATTLPPAATSAPAPLTVATVGQAAAPAPRNYVAPPAPDVSAVAPNTPNLDFRRAGQPALAQPALAQPALAQPQPATPTPPAILPAFQAFGAALHRAATAERHTSSLPEAQLLAAVGTPVPLAAAIDAAPVDATRPDWPQTMIARIEQLRDQQNAPGSTGDTRIRLHPDALGTVDVTLRRDGDGTHVQLAAAEPATRAMLADAQPRLQALAEARGLRLTGSEVAGGNAQGGTGGATGSWSGNDRRPPASPPPTSQRRATAEAASDDSTDTRLA